MSLKSLGTKVFPETRAVGKAAKATTRTKKTTQQASGSNVAARMQKINADFDNLRNLADGWAVLDEEADASLYTALDATFTFGEELRGEQDLLKEFLKQRKISFGKPTQNNPYIGIVKLAFPKLNQTSTSQYSRVLRFAHEVKPADQSVVDWLAGGGGVEGRYKEAVEHYRPKQSAQKQSIRQAKLDKAYAELAKLSLSGRFSLTGPCEVDGYATALVRVTDGKEAELVVLLESDPTKLEPFVLPFFPKMGGVPAVQANGPLARFHRALDLVASTTPFETAGHRRYVLIETFLEDGKPRFRVTSVSEAYSSPCASVTGDGFPEGIAQPGTWFCDGFEGYDLAGEFQQGTDWEIQENGIVRGGYLLDGPAGTLALIPWKAEGSDKKLRSAAKPKADSKPFGVSKGKWTEFLVWNADITERAKKLTRGVKVPGQAPKRLTISVQGPTVSLSVDEVVGPAIDMFELAKSGSIASERWLAIADLETVCKALQRYDLPAVGRFGNMQSGLKDGAIEFRCALDDDELSIWLPLVINDQMEYAAICEAIK